MNGQDPTNGAHGEHDDPQVAAALARFGDTLRSDAVWRSPPADLGERIIGHVAALRAGNGHAGTVDAAAATPPPPASVDTLRPRRRVPWRWPALAAAVALVAFAAGLLLAGDGDDDQRTREPIADVTLTATDLATGASATGDIADAGAGYSINIEVTGLAPAPDGAYYEGWLHDPASGDWVSVGTFHMRSGDSRVVLWSGVPVSRYNELVVTSEVENSTDGRGDILLSGVLDPR